MSTTKRSIESKSKFLSSLSKRGGIETKKKKTDSKKVTTKSKKELKHIEEASSGMYKDFQGNYRMTASQSE